MLRHPSKLASILVRGVSLSRQQNKQFEINSNKEFVSKVMNSSVPVIVNFHAHWCEPCRILTPKLIDLIEPLDKLDLAIIDLELNPELVHIFEVKAVPAVVVISSGLVIDKFIGLVDIKTIEDLIHKLTHQNVLPPSDSEGDRRET
ncbi:thioredoxin, mitochondrial-like [Nomia melanderi]|uniref:thioredoxin, mitochondrial-like n=1 Tax=Nomia melanderi TaxID=2448451 RepID=UPI0013043410|nr:thioredoxin, mitochondrial-like [Nomia melanderi]XP_031849783.1 thioredoxin, mitochondrial-like [Nomia melanderi]XP_031849784.1 thioredoxin, mitochondrial-like [Nomia melanderi]XP_031849785.1 thioredoxin, mitochondrial-like [Nomia melanderi]XP_031849786.1 thioredoxin, mitochondrial-like [Nomia melanderi]XP_031849787.1 thioredoxin, mitochondrial-like [Nomia melanderi]